MGFNKGKIKKVGLTGMLLLASLSLFSVGFSSWSIGNDPSSFVEKISATADEIIDFNSYVIYGSSNSFKYNKDGVVEDETIVYEGYLSVDMTVKMNCDGGMYSLLKDKSSVKFVSFLSNEKSFLKLFDYLDLDETSYSVGNSGTGSYSVTNQKVTSTISSYNVKTFMTITDSSLIESENLYLQIKYKFDFSSVTSTFEESIYNNMSKVQLKVALRANL